MASSTYPTPPTYAGATLSEPSQIGGWTKESSGSLAKNFDNASKKTTVNIVREYPWTLSNVTNRFDIPFVELVEHRANEQLLKRQFEFYSQGAVEAALNFANQGGSKGLLSVYEEIWPDSPTGFYYRFPYFNKTNFELSTNEWQQLDSINQAIGGVLGGTETALRASGATKLAGVVGGAQEAMNLAVNAGQVALAATYPVVGVADRPRVFTGHNGRSVTIQFPLYNTIKRDDFIKNRDFYYRFASQNLFNKRDFITGLPPVFYRVWVPGQYFSFASCVTNFTVENLGNIHYEYQDFIVPDAYQINITLTEMLMPSLNQYQALITGEARGRVASSQQ